MDFHLECNPPSSCLILDGQWHACIHAFSSLVNKAMHLGIFTHRALLQRLLDTLRLYKR
jgi:hypothetical protein